MSLRPEVVLHLYRPGSIATILMFFLLVCVAPAQSAPPKPDSSTPPGTEISQFHKNEAPATSSEKVTPVTNIKRFLSSWEFILSALVMSFGAFVILIEAILLWRSAATPEDTLRTMTVTAIVIGTIFFVAAGFDAVQVAPAAGLFGTIAGYLLGKKVSKTKTP